MRILFGKNLDGGLSLPSWSGAGYLSCGPRGLLDLLDVALGLPPVRAESELARIVSYREALLVHAGENPEAFFVRSLEADSLTTARALLRWRDELRLAGWNPSAKTVNKDGPHRIRSLSEVESQAPGDARFRQDPAARLRRILGSLARGLRTGIDSITVVDAVDSLPRLWRDLMDCLGASFDSFLPDQPAAAEGTALHHLQLRLLGQHDGQKPDFDPSDGSVVILEDFSDFALADAAATLWTDASRCLESVLIAPSDGRDRLNVALRALDLPTISSAGKSPANTLFQLALLALRLHWAPFDPQAWLEFLLHPVCPLSRPLRYRLARAINRTPGRGNEQWNSALGKSLEQASEDPEKRRKMEEQIAFWMHLPTFVPEEDAAGNDLSTTLSLLADWIGGNGRARKVEQPLDATAWLAASSEIRHLGEVLGSMASVSRIEMERLLAAWLLSTDTSPRTAGELGGIPVISSSSQALQSIGHLFWWKPSEACARRGPWTRPEHEWLSRNGMALVSRETALKAEEQADHRAVLHASQSVTLFVSAETDDKNGGLAPIVTRLTAEIGGPIIVGARSAIRTAELPIRPLPAPRRWWQLSDPSLLAPREKESFSSLFKVVYSPYQWVLGYCASLQKGQLFDFGARDDALRRGVFLHDLAERLLATEGAAVWQGFNEAAFKTWLDGIWSAFLAERAAHYLLPGRESARNSLLHTAQQSLWSLVRHLQSAGVTSVEVERRIDGIPFVGGQIHGVIDLLARSSKGMAVIDLKLGGKSKREAELRENRHLQLAVYGQLVRHAEGQDPGAAFFIFSGGGVMLARNSNFFPQASPVSIKGGHDRSEWTGCWSEFEQIWNWRRAQFDAGLIEVPTSDTKVEELPPLAHWIAPKGADRYNDFDALTGWNPIA